MNGQVLAGVGGVVTDGGHVQTSPGITFPATPVPSTDVHTLDAYEEGTFTLILSGSYRTAQ